MEYTIKQLANLSGVSTRTLRYYDEIDLLKPKRIGENGYRIYETEQIDTLEQILCYRSQVVSVVNSDILVVSTAKICYHRSNTNLRNNLEFLCN